MREAQITEKLRQLRSITPDPGFASSSKLQIVYQTPQKSTGVWALTQTLSASVSIGLVIVLFVFVTVLGVSNLRSPLSPTLEGVDKSLTAEADNVNATINIHLEEVQYVTNIAAQTLVKNDQAKQRDNSSDEVVDDLLQEAIEL